MPPITKPAKKSRKTDAAQKLPEAEPPKAESEQNTEAEDPVEPQPKPDLVQEKRDQRFG